MSHVVHLRSVDGAQPQVLKAEGLPQDNFTSFVLHFMHRRCMESPERCAASCINNGRYCAFDSIVDAFAGSFQPRQACPAATVCTLNNTSTHIGQKRACITVPSLSGGQAIHAELLTSVHDGFA